MVNQAQGKDRAHIPQSEAELTARWFTNVLPGVGRVDTVRSAEIGADIGFIGKVYRCHLNWSEGTDPEQPSSVIVKMPTDNDVNFALGEAAQFYEREITVYRHLRDRLGVKVPEHLYSEMDPDPAPWIERPLLFLVDKLPLGGVNRTLDFLLKLGLRDKRRYVLVISDIDDARPPTQADGGSLEDAHAALKVLAKWHATNWMCEDLVAEHKRLWSVDRAHRVFQARYVKNLPGFIAHTAGSVGPATLARLDQIQDRLPEIVTKLGAAPWTLLHGDYRLDNVLFRDNGDLVVLDLQALLYGRPAVDVAYFITTALDPEHSSEEQALLRNYHDALVAEGINALNFDTLVADCELAKELFAHRFISAADIVDTEVSGDRDDLLDVMQVRVFGWLN
jgi:hypothetical protein